MFVQQGAALFVQSGTVEAGTVAAGAAGQAFGGNVPGGAGSAFGGGLFIEGNQAVTLDPPSGQELLVSGAIADENGSVSGSGGAGALIVTGGGIVALTADNTFSGGTTLEGGALLVLDASGAAGKGGIAFAGAGALLLAGGVTLGAQNAVSSFVAGDTIDLLGLTFATGASAIDDGGELTVVSNGITLSVPTSGVRSGVFTARQDAGTGTEVVACFVAGTRIATPGGACRSSGCVRATRCVPGPASRGSRGADRGGSIAGRSGRRRGRSAFSAARSAPACRAVISGCHPIMRC